MADSADDRQPDQTWELTVDGRAHRVEARGSVNHEVHWWVDDELVAQKKAMDDKLRLAAEGRPELGALAVRFSWRGHGIRATVFDEPDQALIGLGGIDLVPEPGSKAAAYEDKIRAHPQRYTATQTALGVGKVVVPIIIAVLLARLAFRIPLPDWDLPHLPWPNLPDLPSPNLPDLSVPDWLTWLLEKAKYVVPVLIAIALAQGEIKRRRKQDALRAELDPDDQQTPGPP